MPGSSASTSRSFEGEIVNRLYTANDERFDATIFNPAAFGTGYPALVAAISQVKFPMVEVHISIRSVADPRHRPLP